MDGRGELKQALADLAVAEVELDRGMGLVLADDLEPPPAPEPWAALLPALDPTVMDGQGGEWFAQTFMRRHVRSHTKRWSTV